MPDITGAHAEDLPDASTARPFGTAPVTQTYVVPPGTDTVSLLGARDQHLRTLERGLPRVDVLARGDEVTVTGPAGDVALALRLLEEMGGVLAAGQPLSADAVERSLSILRDTDGGVRPAQVLTANILSNRGRTIRPKTLNQKRYVDAIDENTITFGIGPAGTGKTYLAMAKAVQALQSKTVNRIVLTRPAVEAGERLGFLPGTLTDKIDPYLRPLYDALHDMVDPESIPRLITAGTIEVAPLAYMRGRAQPYDANVLTPDGWTTMGSLQVGDLVTGSDGRPTPVLGVFPRGPREVFRVTAQDGASTLACGEHLWQVRTASDKRRGRHRVVETRQMRGSLRAAHARRYELPVVQPIAMPARPVPMDPYALGLLLGDGCLTISTTPSFSTADPELAGALAAALPEIELVREGRYHHVLRNRSGARGGVIVTNPVTALLRELGIAGTRSSTTFVPATYLDNATEVRLGVLQGLLDTDGVPVKQVGRTCRVQYTTTSDRLRDDVVHLVRSLGGVVHVRTRAAVGRRPGPAHGRPVSHVRDAHVLDIRLPAGMAPFRLSRKRHAYDAGTGGRPMRFVDSIEPAGVQDTMCIQVAAADALYVTDDFLLTHNTLNDAFIILDEAQNTSPEQMKMFLTRLGFGSKMVVTGDITQVDLPGSTASGLRVVRDILGRVEDVHFAYLEATDVVRHRLIADIVQAYDRWDGSAG